MPTSRPFTLNYIAQQILEKKPKTFLDIGIGFGKYGFLAREYLDIWDGPQGCWYRENWKYRIDGIEVFEDYITELQKYIYSNIYIGNAIEIINDLKNYNFAVCTAMLEHLKKEDGLKFLEQVKSKCDYSIFTVPINPGSRGAKHNNVNQAHISKWTKEDLLIFGKVTNIKDFQFMLEM